MEILVKKYSTIIYLIASLNMDILFILDFLVAKNKERQLLSKI